MYEVDPGPRLGPTAAAASLPARRGDLNTEACGIINRREKQVNLTNGMKATLFIVIAWAMCLGAACTGPEGRAEGMYEESMEKITAGDLQEGVSLLQQVISEYPDTAAAGQARKEIDLYRGIAGAVENYPVASARDLMVRTARVLERLRFRRRLPAALDDLVPQKLDSTPVDPWGEALIYVRSSNGRGYSLISLGSDGAEGGSGAARDIVIRNGEFKEGGW